MIDVKKMVDGAIEFTEDGEHLYDLFVTEAEPFVFWIDHLDDKQWFNGCVRNKFIEIGIQEPHYGYQG